MTMAKLKIDKNLCIGCGSCAVEASKTFQMNDDEFKAEIKKAPWDSDNKITSAIGVCPTEAIIKG